MDISEAIKCLARAMSETESRSHDAIEMSGEVLERSAKKSTAKSQAERTWKCTWRVIGLETQ